MQRTFRHVYTYWVIFESKNNHTSLRVNRNHPVKSNEQLEELTRDIYENLGVNVGIIVSLTLLN